MDEARSVRASAGNSNQMETHPRVLFGKRAEAGVPHKDWREVSREDLEDELQLCEMCESQEIRHIVYMQHPDYPHILGVGGDCAEMMGPDGGETLLRRREKRNRAARRKRWLTRKWKASPEGNPFLKAGGYRVSVWPKGAGWSFAVSTEEAESHYGTATFSTPDEAKLAAFDFIWPAVSQVM
jgi:hypothetical protein